VARARGAGRARSQAGVEAGLPARVVRAQAPLANPRLAARRSTP